MLASKTLKLTLLLLLTPPTVTITPTVPVAAPAGTVTTICVSDQLTTDALAQQQNQSVLFPWVAPKPLPLICTCAPIVPLVGETLVITGLGVENVTSGLLHTLLTTTCTGPLPTP